MGLTKHKRMDAGFTNAVAQLVQNRGAMRYLVRLLVKEQKCDVKPLGSLNICLNIRWGRERFAGDFVKRLIQLIGNPVQYYSKF